MASAARPGLVFAGLALFGLAALVVATGAAGGGHGSYLPAKLLFPFTMLLALPRGPISPFGMVLAVLQFPVYGGILAAAFAAGRQRYAVAIVVGLHVLAAAAAVAISRGGPFPS